MNEVLLLQRTEIVESGGFSRKNWLALPRHEPRPPLVVGARGEIINDGPFGRFRGYEIPLLQRVSPFC